MARAVLLRATFELRRRVLPDRPVRRVVQGVSMVLPRAHRLPDYAALYPAYGQNLVRVAESLGRGGGGALQVLDIGANIGDSALQICSKVEAKVLCVEGDPYWMPFLDRNVEALPAVVVEECFLSTTADTVAVEAVRGAGTTMFVPSEGSSSVRHLTVDEVIGRHPDFDSIRLVKSDTDGYDTTLVPHAARACAASHPVVFFEFDPAMTRKVGIDDPHSVWPELAALGYSKYVVWDNLGTYLMTPDNDGVLAAAAVLDTPRSSRSYDYWDVAAVHAKDVGLAESLIGDGSARG